MVEMGVPEFTNSNLSNVDLAKYFYGCYNYRLRYVVLEEYGNVNQIYAIEKYMKDVNEKIKKEYALTFGFSVRHSRCDNKLELVITHVCLYEDNQIKKVVPFSLWLFD